MKINSIIINEIRLSQQVSFSEDFIIRIYYFCIEEIELYNFSKPINFFSIISVLEFFFKMFINHKIYFQI